MHFSLLYFLRRSLIIFHNPERCTVISRPSCFNLPVSARQCWNCCLPTLSWEPDGLKRANGKRKPMGTEQNLVPRQSFLPLKKKKKDWCACGVSGAEIAIRSDYPRPLTAADSMSQSGMCIINQRRLRRPRSSRLLPAARRPPPCTTEWRTIPSRVTKHGARRLQGEQRSGYWRDVAAANEHSDALNSSPPRRHPSTLWRDEWRWGENSDLVTVSTRSSPALFPFAGFSQNKSEVSKVSSNPVPLNLLELHLLLFVCRSEWLMYFSVWWLVKKNFHLLLQPIKTQCSDL